MRPKCFTRGSSPGKPTGGLLELLLLDPRGQPVEWALNAQSPVMWNAMVGGAKKWKSGPLEVPDSGCGLQVERYQTSLKFTWEGGERFGPSSTDWARFPCPLTCGGKPMRPMKTATRRCLPDCREVWPHPRRGSIDRAPARPGGGLRGSLRQGDLARRGGDLQAAQRGGGVHEMHGERCLVSPDALRALSGIRDLTVVGTTPTSAPWRVPAGWPAAGSKGARVPRCPSSSGSREVDAVFADFAEAAAWLAGQVEGQDLEFVTHLMVVPGYRVRSARRLFTNFHMPNSTLLCIVEAMLGPGWREVYAHAVQQRYRFLSYGDACLLERRD